MYIGNNFGNDYHQMSSVSYLGDISVLIQYMEVIVWRDSVYTFSLRRVVLLPKLIHDLL